MDTILSNVGLSASSMITLRPKLMLVGMIGFIFFLLDTIVCSVVANHIRNSECKNSDESIKTAYKWAWVPAVVSGVLMFLCFAGTVGIGVSYFI